MTAAARPDPKVWLVEIDGQELVGPFTFDGARRHAALVLLQYPPPPGGMARKVDSVAIRQLIAPPEKP